jgi:UDP-glucuronate 4-epimerase
MARDSIPAREDILVTGAAGFIGFHVAARLLDSGRPVIGIDNLNDYYDPALKMARLAHLAQYPEFRFLKLDIADRTAVADLFAEHRFSRVVHLAAQPGVRRSLTDPYAYVEANVTGFLNILEGCRHNDCGHLVYASSSSVYGANTAMPFSTSQNVDHPLSLYAATKKTNELMAHAYAHLFALPCTGLRFFTVYGPWGRPDMAVWLFTAAIVEGRPIRLFNQGEMERDFTYVDDVAEAIARLIDKPAMADASWSSERPEPASSTAPWRVYNIGNRTPVELRTLVKIIEDAVGKRAIVELLPMQPGDARATYADVEALTAAVGFAPRTAVDVGIGRFVTWYREHYRV